MPAWANPSAFMEREDLAVSRHFLLLLTTNYFRYFFRVWNLSSTMAQIRFRFLFLVLAGLAGLFSTVKCGHFLNADGTPHDMYHDLHVPRNPPLYPTYHEVPRTSFSCEGKEWGYHADTEAQCQAYHLCQGKIVKSFLCPNATLFHNQFKACDQFYNVRCGVDLEDL